MNLVSVIISIFNKADSLQLALESVKNQTYKNIEIIIVNCTDEILEDIEEPIISLGIKIYNSESLVTIREEAMKLSKGEWICFLDSKDYWYPYKLEKQLTQLSKHTSILFSCSNMDVGEGLYLPDNTYTKHRSYNLQNIFYKHTLDHSNYVNYSSVIIHKTVVNTDWYSVLQCTPCLYISEPLLYSNCI